MLRATGDRNVASIGERDECERVLQALRCGHVAGNHGQRSNVELGRIQREENGNRVVGAGIGVDDDFAGSGGLRCGRGEGGDEATADQEKCECLGRHTQLKLLRSANKPSRFSRFRTRQPDSETHMASGP